VDVLPSVQGQWLDFSVSKIFLLQCHWLVSSKIGLLFKGYLPFQSSILEESGSSHIQTTTFVLSPRPMHYTKEVIYFGTQHNELLPVYITTINHIHSK
jgi:hypothetical protein